MSDLETFDDNGTVRVLGNRPSDPGMMRAAGSWAGAGNPVVPESEWTEFDEWPTEIHIKNQGQFGACNGHAAAMSLELARYVAGQPHVPLSAWWVYGNLTGGRDVGSNPMDALTLLSGTGCAPESDVPWGMFNPRKFTAAAKSDAPRFKAEQGVAITDPDELMTAVQLRRPINGTIYVGRGFNNLDDEGVPGLVRGQDNHAVTYAFGAKKLKKRGWSLKMINSWDTTWGLKGFCWVPLDYLCRNPACEYYDVPDTSADPQDKTNLII